jgi:catechol 2,3-dioxygenase-like lactoylglutathione lyase family enzyme
MEPRISIITLGVADLERSYRFYHEGLGLPTPKSPEDGIIFFQTGGTCLALYPLEALAEDISPTHPAERGPFPGITLAHNTRTKEEVDALLAQAEKHGAVIEKPAQDTFWGGYSGYFSDPDGYLWEVAYADSWEFNPDGSLVIT